MLEAEKQAEILHLHFNQKSSIRAIAKKVVHDRKSRHFQFKIFNIN